MKGVAGNGAVQVMRCRCVHAPEEHTPNGCRILGCECPYDSNGHTVSPQTCPRCGTPYSGVAGVAHLTNGCSGDRLAKLERVAEEAKGLLHIFERRRHMAFNSEADPLRSALSALKESTNG